MFTALPAIFPVTCEPGIAVVAAIEDAMTPFPRVPAATCAAGRLPVMFAAFPEIFPVTWEPVTVMVAAIEEAMTDAPRVPALTLDAGIEMFPKLPAAT